MCRRGNFYIQGWQNWQLYYPFLYSTYVYCVCLEFSGIQEWVIQITAIPILVSGIFHFRIKSSIFVASGVWGSLLQLVKCQNGRRSTAGHQSAPGETPRLCLQRQEARGWGCSPVDLLLTAPFAAAQAALPFS